MRQKQSQTSRCPRAGWFCGLVIRPISQQMTSEHAMKNQLRHFAILVACFVTLVLPTLPARAELVGHWTFEEGEELTDLTGNFPDLALQGDAAVVDGALDVNGTGTTATGWAFTTGGAGYTGPDITNKTMVSWVTLQDLSVRAGSALTLDRVGSDQFDGMIWAEMDADRWMMGSNGFSRSPGPPQSHFIDPANTGTLGMIQLAYSFEDTGGGNVQITGYIDGVQIGQYADNPLVSWSAGDTEVIFGKRHGNPATAGPGGLDALIDEARIYNTVLTQEEIQALTLMSLVDSDDDGLDDAWEQEVIDSDPDDAIETLADVNPGDDLDGDNLTNLQEFMFPRTDPLDADSDDDNLTDDIETGTGTFVDATDTGTNPNDPDSDGDGLQDDVETNTENYVSPTNTGTDPNNPDSDGDGLSDGDEIADPFSDPNNPNDPPPPPFEGALVGHWTFDPGEEMTDLTGNWPDLELNGDASIADGVLNVNGAGTTATGTAGTGPGDYTGPEIREKTLVSWVTLEDLDVRAGSVITIDTQTGDVFDGIIWAEQNPNRWMAGSNGFQRTQPFTAPDDSETVAGEQVMVAITYADNGAGTATVTGYRNGVQIGQYDRGPFVTYPDPPGATGAEIIFGRRHQSVAAGPGALDALIDEARIYAAAATPAQILDIFNAGPGGGGDALRFTEIVYDAAAGEAVATWVSKVGKTYRVDWSPDLNSPIWVEETDSYPDGGATSERTAFTYAIPPGTTRRYFRVTEEP